MLYVKAQALKRGTNGKTALVCGKSKNIGMPMTMLLHIDRRHKQI